MVRAIHGILTSEHGSLPNMAPMQYFEKAQSTFQPPLVANENAFLGDVGSTFVLLVHPIPTT
jgi:hypothetical protein